MNEETEARIAALEKELKEFKLLFASEVARLNKIDDEDNAVLMRYIERHGDHHDELYRKISASYARTHPEVIDTLIQCDKILGVGAPPKAPR